jgi:hypothetical protein
VSDSGVHAQQWTQTPQRRAPDAFDLEQIFDRTEAAQPIAQSENGGGPLVADSGQAP